MSKKPKISVIIPVFNQEKYLSRCLRSLIDQTLEKKDYEIIVVNDGSTDRTRFVAEMFKDEIKIINNKKNKGLPFSINEGILSARGRYIVRVDSDDYVSRNFLYLCKLFLNLNREYQAVAVDYFKVDDKEQILEKINCFKKQIACGILFRKECLIDIGLYNEKFKMREGHDLRIKFEKKFKIARLNIPLYKYRSHSKNRTKKTKILKKYNNMLKGKK